MRSGLALGVFLCTMLFAGCGDAQRGTAPPSASAQSAASEPGWVRTELYCGLSTQDRTVSEAEWEQFVRDFVTPRLKEGLTVINGYGQWLAPEGTLVTEKSKVVVFVHKANGQYEAAIEEVRSEYKRRFDQSSVLRVDVPARASY